MSRCPSILCTCLIMALAMPAVALGDGRGFQYAAGNLAFDLPNGVEVREQEVRVSLDMVRITYIFSASVPQKIHLRFSMPDMPVDASPDAVGYGESDRHAEAAGLAADTQPPNYLNLAIRANDVPVVLNGSGRALFDGEDVTRRLLDAGVPLLYDLGAEAPWQHLAPDVQAALRVSGLLDEGAAQWSYQASFGWEQSFLPGKTRIDVTYTPVAHYWSDINLADFPEIAPDGPAARAYCIDDAVRRAFHRNRFYELYSVTHVMAPGNGWRGPVGHFRLVVDKGAAANLVAFCPLAAKKVSPTTFEWTATNFTPERQLGVLFFVKPAPASAGAE